MNVTFVPLNYILSFVHFLLYYRAAGNGVAFSDALKSLNDWAYAVFLWTLSVYNSLTVLISKYSIGPIDRLVGTFEILSEKNRSFVGNCQRF